MRRPRRLAALCATAALTALSALAVFAPAAGAVPLVPEPSNSPNAEDLREAFSGMLVVAVMIGGAINVALIVAVLRFRARRDSVPAQVRGGTGIQSRVGILLGAMALAIFVFGLLVTVQARDVAPSGADGLEASSLRTAQIGLEPPEGESEPLSIQVSGQQWLWRYEYPDGTFSYYDLVVPVDTTVVLQLDSTDVVHRWSVPALSGSFDAVPGRANTTWFRAEEEGAYEGQSKAFSGSAFPAMRARVVVLSVTEYEAWLELQASEIQAAQEAIQSAVEAENLEAADEADAADEAVGDTASQNEEPGEGAAPGGETP